ncbi:hypothetical protein IEQ34_022585 [Dendrobium chrysotoxum]|uniref:DUF4283 domain-containing protein n=1 Tax=Dendrobium chrysotoxum TaxID=161865 RepID=A0AAV7FK61_DENCH|nr:hypothetical protein IEQ34_022585 [Dendrobium chrysotoxum]
MESLVIPIWISFPNMRLHLFFPRILHGLDSLFGRLLKVDNATCIGSRPLLTAEIFRRKYRRLNVGRYRQKNHRIAVANRITDDKIKKNLKRWRSPLAKKMEMKVNGRKSARAGVTEAKAEFG